MLDIKEDIIQNVQNIAFIQRQNLSSHSYQKSAKENTLNYLKITFMYYPKHLLVLARRYKTSLALCPLSKKKWSLSKVASTIVRGMSSRMELIFSNQFLQIYWADSGMLVPYKSFIVISLILSSLYWGKLRLFILLKTLRPNY